MLATKKHLLALESTKLENTSDNVETGNIVITEVVFYLPYKVDNKYYNFNRGKKVPFALIKLEVLVNGQQLFFTKKILML